MTKRITGEQRLRAALAAALDAECRSVAERWMDEIAPAGRLIDHLPALIAEIARHLVAPEAETLVANTQVFAKAAELGSLRFEQRATIHQILREYELVADLLSQFVLEHIGSTNVRCTPVDALRAVDSVRAAVRLLQRQTIPTRWKCGPTSCARRGYHVMRVRTGLEAIERAEGGDPDVILLDLQLAEMSGLDAARRLRASQKTAHIPLIAVTGFSHTREHDAAREAGFSAVMGQTVRSRRSARRGRTGPRRDQR